MFLVRILDGQIVESGCEHDFHEMEKKMAQKPNHFNLIAIVYQAEPKHPNDISTLVPILGFANHKQISF